MKKLSIIIAALSILSSTNVFAQIEIPAIYSNMFKDERGYYIKDGATRLYEIPTTAKYSIANFINPAIGTANGLAFDFKMNDFNGSLYYGFLNYKEWKYPQPVYYKSSAEINNGKATIDILNNMRGKYDMIDWEKNRGGIVGYRVCDAVGRIIFDGIVEFKWTNTFEVVPTIASGPFISIITDTSAVITFSMNIQDNPTIECNGKTFNPKFQEILNYYEFEINGLSPNKVYEYTVKYGQSELKRNFQTAPREGTRSAFSFAFSSDSRSGRGGGERDIYATNKYIIKKSFALANFFGSKFYQFTGDMISGYTDSFNDIMLQYWNWKESVSPFTSYMPVYVGIGNHEHLGTRFADEKKNMIALDKFPFQDQSMESAFAYVYTSPLNGPESEDGSKYDPNPNKIDFPSYKENVYYYIYDNIAMIVLNSNYLYAPDETKIALTGGNPHAYIMDNQLQWFRQTIEVLENNPNIDHIFVTLHTPALPNGGHKSDDMWYDGNNGIKPYIAGKAVDKGIIERRDEFFDILINQSKKAVALLSGDEHNYSRTKITPTTNLYPDNYPLNKLKISREFWQITNGSAGAPYYAQEELPWTADCEIFSTQYALLIFKIDGKNIILEAWNPDTLEKIEEIKLR